MDSTGKTTEPPQLPPQAAFAAQISAVLGNDDLLHEILLRLDSPNYLVRAAAVSKRWLRHASDPAFLRRFRRLHPPRLLGFYVDTSILCMCYVSLLQKPPPPELAAVIHRAKILEFSKDARNILDCRNGRLILYVQPNDGIPSAAVCRPLHPERGASALPLPHIPGLAHDPLDLYFHRLLLRDDGGDDMAISAVTVTGNEGQVRVRLMDFQAGEWGECRNSDLIQLSGRWIGCQHSPLLDNGKIYMMCMAQYILGLDVQSMSSFSIKLPNGVEYVTQKGFAATNIALSRAEGSGFCLVHARMSQICVWRYTMDHSNTGSWELIDTVSLRQVFGPSADPSWCSQDADVRVTAAGDNADFVFLRIQKEVFYLHISSRTVERVFGVSQHDPLFRISPFTMVWPPTFPTLNGGHDNDE